MVFVAYGYVIRCVRLLTPRSKAFPETIKEFSPTFCEIYNEAARAEASELKHICGPGYRKALEYLIKDYLTNYAFKDDPVKNEQITHTLLGPCVENYVDEQRIKAAAKRAAWLGNDETHYPRKWIDKDLSDLLMRPSKCARITSLASGISTGETGDSREHATHYLMVGSVKTLISMTVNWIDLVVQSDNYEKGMTEEKGKKK